MTREETKAILQTMEYELSNQVSSTYCRKKYDAIKIAIKALEQESILDKIRAEIDKARFVDKDTRICKNALASGLEVAMQIIDKYKAESEG